MSETLTEGVAAGDATENAPVDVPPEPVAAPAPSWDDPAMLDLVDARAQALFDTRFGPILPLVEQILAGDQTAATVAGSLDPFSDTFAGDLDARFARMEQIVTDGLSQLQAPLAERAQQERAAEGEQRLQDILADDIARNGEFAANAEADGQARQLVRTIANQLYPGLEARYGGEDVVLRSGLGPRLAEQAMGQAASRVRELLASARTDAVSQETNRLTTLATTRGEPGIGAAGVASMTDGKPLTTRELALKYGGRANALRGPTG